MFKITYYIKMESVLLAITGILCSILFIKLLFSLRTILPWRVNCWFCNSNFWVKFAERNCWTCRKCDQYNGFTKDGDYNRPLFTYNCQDAKSPKVFQSSPPRNGLCKMCNINQTLKVTQLANFIPINENNYDEEIEAFRIQLEKAYKLCSPCRKVLQIKLHKEKETLLGSKLIETRTPQKNQQKQEIQNRKVQSFINSTSKYIAGFLLVLILFESYMVLRQKNLHRVLINTKDFLSSLIKTIYSILKKKTLMTFPSLENYLSVHIIDLGILKQQMNFSSHYIDGLTISTQKALGGFVCLIQIIGHLWTSNNNLKFNTIVVDLLWSIFVVTSIAHSTLSIDPILVSMVKLVSVLLLLGVYDSMTSKTTKSIKTNKTPKNMKNMSTSATSKMIKIEEEDTTSFETDDDVSLSKFGLRDFSDCSNETVSPKSVAGSRGFSPRARHGLWSRPKLNSSFCASALGRKSPSSVSDTVFVKPTFSKYQDLTKDESDSDLDESISSLCIGSPGQRRPGGSVFSLRTFTAAPRFVAPVPLSRRPLISPSKLGHSTSWVAGGYWGGEGERRTEPGGSRSSSQSSGFESQASSVTRRDEPERAALLLERLQCHAGGLALAAAPAPFAPAPVFPALHVNAHVPLPPLGRSAFARPGASGLIKLPPHDSFAR